MLSTANNFQATVELAKPITSYSQAETITVQYKNTGNAAMPAPLLALHAFQNGREDALLSLDSSNQNVGLDTSSTPPGYSQSVEFLASGATPGLLAAGETAAVSVYFGGWLRSDWNASNPTVSFSLDLLTADNSSSVPWSSLQTSLQPAGISTADWNALFPTVQSQLGATWGSFVQRLDQDATYLNGLGEQVDDVNQFWSFEVQQADGLNPQSQLSATTDIAVTVPGVGLSIDRTFSSSIIGRTTPGPFGEGWAPSDAWFESLAVNADQSVTIGSQGAPRRTFAPTSTGSYLDQAGDFGTLANLGLGVYTLTETDGTVTEFINGRFTYLQDANGNRVTAAYTNGLLTGLADSNGQFLTLAYNGASLVSSITSSTGQSASYSYDATNTHLVSVTDFHGETTLYTYAPTSGALNSVVAPDGTQQNFAYDAQGRLDGSSLNGGAQSISYAYGPGGLVTATDALGDSSSYYFDDQGNLAKVVNPLQQVTLYQHDSNGDLTKVTNAAGQSFVYSYGPQGTLTQSVDPAGHITTYTYGPLHQIASVTSPNQNTTKYQYNQAGDLTSTTFADGTVETDAVNPIGEVYQSQDGNGSVTAYAYNAAGQLTSESFGDGTQATFSYDQDGNLVTATNSTGTTRLSYVDDRLTKIVYPDGASLAYSYDASGRTTQMVDQTGYTVNYAYTAAGQLSQLTDGSGASIVTYSYDAAGRLAEALKGNQTYTKYSYDAAGDVLSVVNYAPSRAVNSSFTYTYNSLGLRATETTSDGSWTYSYDADGELTHAVFASSNTAQIANQDLQYFYDADGNRTKTIINGVTTNYTANNRDEYTQVGGDTLSYDRNGNLISDSGPSGVTTYGHNAAGRLASIQAPAGTSESFQYDSLGNLYSNSLDGETTQDLVDPTGLGNLVSQYSSTGSLLAHYNYGLGLVDQQSATQTTLYYDFDALGSTAGLTNAFGDYAAQYAYLPFGGMLAQSGIASTAFQFDGQWGTISSGSYELMRSRMEDTNLGRFDSPDPSASPSAENEAFTYASNDPVLFSDPTGLFRWLQFVQGAAQVIGGAVGAVGGAALVVDTAGVATLPGWAVITEGVYSVGAGIANITNSFQDVEKSVPGGVLEAVGSAVDGETGKKLGKVGDLILGAGIDLPLTELGTAIHELADAVDLGITYGETAAELQELLAPAPSNPPGPQNVPQPSAPQTPLEQDQSPNGSEMLTFAFNPDDTLATTKDTSLDSTGAEVTSTSVSYTYNDGALESTDALDFSGSHNTFDSSRTDTYSTSGDELTNVGFNVEDASGQLTSSGSDEYQNGLINTITDTTYTDVNGTSQANSTGTYNYNTLGELAGSTVDLLTPSTGALASIELGVYTYTLDDLVLQR